MPFLPPNQQRQSTEGILLGVLISNNCRLTNMKDMDVPWALELVVQTISSAVRVLPKYWTTHHHNIECFTDWRLTPHKVSDPRDVLLTQSLDWKLNPTKCLSKNIQTANVTPTIIVWIGSQFGPQNWLPWQYPLRDQNTNFQSFYQRCKFGEDRPSRCWDNWAGRNR